MEMTHLQNNNIFHFLSKEIMKGFSWLQRQAITKLVEGGSFQYWLTNKFQLKITN